MAAQRGRIRLNGAYGTIRIVLDLMEILDAAERAELQPACENRWLVNWIRDHKHLVATRLQCAAYPEKWMHIAGAVKGMDDHSQAHLSAYESILASR